MGLIQVLGTKPGPQVRDFPWILHGATPHKEALQSEGLPISLMWDQQGKEPSPDKSALLWPCNTYTVLLGLELTCTS